jgi:hypothetical protein
MSQVSAQEIQLEAREEQKKWALAALDNAIQLLDPNTTCPCSRCLTNQIDAARLAIREAIEQLEGRATP